MSLTLDLRQRAIESAVGGEDRYVDIAFALTRSKDASTLLFAGGQWDHFDRRFTGKDPERVAVVALEESQVTFTRWFATFLDDYREGYPRDISLALVAGDRRGGKTFDTFLCQIAALIDVPRYHDGTPTIGWAISRTYRERDELDQLISNRLPDTYYRQQRAPEHRYTFPHGSYLRNLSADDPNSLRQGRVDFLLYNEPQRMGAAAIKNGLYGTSDRSGLCLLAANPPSGPEGEWLRDLKEGIDEDPEVRSITRFFNFSSKDNTKIDQPARKRVAKIARKIDPEGNDGDADGTWRRWGDLACPAFNKRSLDKGGLVGPVPEVGAAADVTQQATRAVFYSSWRYVIGGDFQRRPQAAAVLRVYTVPGIVGNVYWFVGECGVKGTEVELSTELMGFPHSYTPDTGSDRSAVWIGDCSGSYQGAERIRGTTSYTLLESQGWKVFPAEIIKGERSEHPKNPNVALRLGLLYRLMEAKRLRVSPECVWLIESFSKCQLRKTETGTRVPKGHLAHILDAASYAVWRLEPKAAGHKGPPAKSSMKTANLNIHPIRSL